MNGANIQKRGKTLPAVLGAVLLLLSACSEIIRNHGYVPPEGDLNALIVGVDTRDTLAASIGRPSTSGVVQDQSWYYIGSQVRHFGARKPEEINREVVAISFNGAVAPRHRNQCARRDIHSPDHPKLRQFRLCRRSGRLAVRGLKLQRHAVDAIAQPGGLRAVGKDMPQMTVTGIAMHFSAFHEPAGIGAFAYIVWVNRGIK